MNGKMSLSEAHSLLEEAKASYDTALDVYEKYSRESHSTDIMSMILSAETSRDHAEIRKMIEYRARADHLLYDMRATLTERLRLISEIEYQVKIMEDHQANPTLNESSVGKCSSCDHLRPVDPMKLPWKDKAGRRLDERRDICALTQRKPDPDPGGCKRYRLTVGVDVKT